MNSIRRIRTKTIFPPSFPCPSYFPHVIPAKGWKQEGYKAGQALVTANRELITRFEKKIQATLARVWGEDV